jgi:catechol-2,3-dioxygenase
MTAGMKAREVTRLGQIGVPVYDVEPATAFYHDALGLRYCSARNCSRCLRRHPRHAGPARERAQNVTL